MLPRLNPADLAVVAQVGPPWLAAVVASGLARAGKTVGVPLRITEFVGSAERLAWAKANGCPWTARTCIIIARGGRLEVLRWASGCPWDERTCAAAAGAGHLEMLQWAREHGYPWDEDNDVTAPRSDASSSSSSAASSSSSPSSSATSSSCTGARRVIRRIVYWCSLRHLTAGHVIRHTLNPLRHTLDPRPSYILHPSAGFICMAVSRG